MEFPPDAACLAGVAGDQGNYPWIWLGGLMSTVADLIVPFGITLQKLGILQAEKAGTHHTKILKWWFGLFTMIGGELGNLVAYGLAPAALVAALGAIGLAGNVGFASLILKEPFTRQIAKGVALDIVGIILVAVGTPQGGGFRCAVHDELLGYLNTNSCKIMAPILVAAIICFATLTWLKDQVLCPVGHRLKPWDGPSNTACSGCHRTGKTGPSIGPLHRCSCDYVLCKKCRTAQRFSRRGAAHPWAGTRVRILRSSEHPSRVGQYGLLEWKTHPYWVRLRDGSAISSQRDHLEVCQQFVLFPLITCGLFGAFTVLASKATSSMVLGQCLECCSRCQWPGEMLVTPLFWVQLIFVIVPPIMQLHYLNFALARFDNQVVIPIFYVAFTGFSMVTSAILYQEVDWEVYGTPAGLLKGILFLLGLCLLVLGTILMAKAGGDRRQEGEEQDINPNDFVPSSPRGTQTPDATPRSKPDQELDEKVSTSDTAASDNGFSNLEIPVDEPIARESGVNITGISGEAVPILPHCRAAHPRLLAG